MSWLACDSKHVEKIWDLLGAREKSAQEEVSFCATVTLEERLFVFEARGRDWTFHRNDERKRLSAGHEVFFCMLDEHVMASEIACWKEGVEIWRVEHNSEEGVYHLVCRGNPPPSFESVKQARIDQQDKEGGEECGVDFIISVPMDLAAEFTGYDGGIDEPSGSYSEWSSTTPPKSVGFFGRLFR